MQYPLGVGTGNVDEVLGSKLRSMHLPNLAKQNYNPHNQYLQTGVEIGIVGLLLLIGMVLYLIRKGWRQRNWLILAITANFAINMLFESMLQRQSGIVFYAFILLLLSLYSDSKTETVS
jgi:O-antigen ligase